MLGAVLVPVITELVQLTFSTRAPMTFRSRARTTTLRPEVLRRAHRSELRMAVASGLVGAAIVGSIFTLPPLAIGQPLNDTPLSGGRVPIIETPEPSVPQGEVPRPTADPPETDLDVDTDGDGIADAGDNCPTIANEDQANTNGNGRGDACDPDDDNDNDGTPDGHDAFPMDATK